MTTPAEPAARVHPNSPGAARATPRAARATPGTPGAWGKPAHGSTWQRVWPPDLLALLAEPRTLAVQVPPLHPRDCLNCGGLGNVGVQVMHSGPYPSPRGKCTWLEKPRPGWYAFSSEWAPCPVCQADQARQHLERNCGLQGSDLRVSLETFRAKGLLAAKLPALEAARALLGMNTRPAGFVTFTSPLFGVGKSHLLKALVNGFRGVGVLARYATLPDLLQEIKNQFNTEDRPEEVIQNYRRARVLCLDEVDKAQLSGWAQETLFRLLNSRYEERGALLTVLASNTPPDKLADELGYLASRMRGGLVVPVAGPDMRGAGKNEHR
jgi:DNA replication protein DnaC